MNNMSQTARTLYIPELGEISSFPFKNATMMYYITYGYNCLGQKFTIEVIGPHAIPIYLYMW
jgi:hypothetical protein